MVKENMADLPESILSSKPSVSIMTVYILLIFWATPGLINAEELERLNQNSDESIIIQQILSARQVLKRNLKRIFPEQRAVKLLPSMTATEW